MYTGLSQAALAAFAAGEDHERTIAQRKVKTRVSGGSRVMGARQRRNPLWPPM